MTDRRTLGTGPGEPGHLRASQADLLDSLPGVHLPDLDQLRERGVLGARPEVPPTRRRTLGVGGRQGEESPERPWSAAEPAPQHHEPDDHGTDLQRALEAEQSDQH
ncbi:hypothetical protein [Streptomyces chartreusis]|uniref:hypothetical protein n=1 Tax=Streptomyces chartreusis TaxID=1969 RepID=UPI003826F465